jgi:hypothetical protein
VPTLPPLPLVTLPPLPGFTVVPPLPGLTVVPPLPGLTVVPPLPPPRLTQRPEAQTRPALQLLLG